MKQYVAYPQRSSFGDIAAVRHFIGNAFFEVVVKCFKMIFYLREFALRGLPNDFAISLHNDSTFVYLPIFLFHFI